jgi:hypothetical protein
VKGCVVTLLSTFAVTVYLSLFFWLGYPPPDSVFEFPSPDGRYQLVIEYCKERGFLGNHSSNVIELKKFCCCIGSTPPIWPESRSSMLLRLRRFVFARSTRSTGNSSPF